MALHASQRAPPPRLLSIHLAPFRHDAAQRMAKALRISLDSLQAALATHGGETTRDFDALFEEAIARLRASAPTGWRRILWRLDRAMYRDGEEMMDNPHFAEDLRTHILSVLDRFNLHVGNYNVWAGAIAPYVDATTRGRSLRILEIAAGHGGFSVYLKKRFGNRVNVTASDITEEYLAIGRRCAGDTGADITFTVHDAMRLDGIKSGDVDLVVCTQSLHHFTPGQIARMLTSAARVAKVAVLFVDGERDPGPFLIMPIFMALYGRSWPVVHDTLVSVRRMYAAEELALIAYATPGLPPGTAVEYGRLPPGHGFITARMPEEA